MPPPAIQQRIVRRYLEAAREGLDRFAILAHAGLRDAQRDDPIDIARIGGQRALGARNGTGIALRTVFDARGRAILDRLQQAERRKQAEERVHDFPEL